MKSSQRLFTVNLHGGNGKQNGASGFFYEHSYSKNTEKAKLVLDNGGLGTSNTPSVLLCDTKTIDHTFDEIRIMGSASMHMKSCKNGSPMTLIGKTVSGDKTGLLITQRYHDSYIGVTGVVLSKLELPFNVQISDGGTLSLPSTLVIRGTSLGVSGSLVGVKDMTVDTNGELVLDFPGHTGYRQAPQGGVSSSTFERLRIKKGGRVRTKTAGKVRINAITFEQDYGATFESPAIALSSQNKVVENKGPSLGRVDCPHGYETVATASPTLYNPCGTGKHVWQKSNVSYIVTHNVSKTVYRRVWNGSLSSIQSSVVYYLVHETRYNVTYNIGCDYNNFTLLAGQTCTFKPGNYTYNTLKIQSDATMNFEASNNKNTLSFLTAAKIMVKPGGNLQALTSNFDNALPVQNGQGGSYGGLGGGNTNKGFLYGNLYSPVHYGSYGGGTVQYRGRGGGALVMMVNELDLDGTVDASGNKGSNGAGGGSGGSIFIKATSITGSGTISARGGQGGGGGGRIAIRAYHSMENIKVNFDVTGGHGASIGGSGTVVFRYFSKSPVHDTFFVDGKYSSECLLPPSVKQYSFGKLHVRSGVFSTSGQSVLAKELLTEKGGKIIVDNNGKLEILDIDHDGKEVKCDFDVRSGGTLNFTGKVVFSGPSNPTVVVSGQLIATQPEVSYSKRIELKHLGQIQTSSLKLRKNSRIDIGVSSSISKAEGKFDSLVLESYSIIDFKTANVTLVATSLLMSKGSLISSSGKTKYFNITADKLTIESDAKISATTGGILRGLGSPLASGSGAGHGGQGGGKNGGSAYGSVFNPQRYGSGLNSRGGGIIYITVKQTLSVHGHIECNGETHSSGGGSGGSLQIRAMSLEGHGNITANGGHGGTSGGGSGGRIAVYVTKNAFKGTILAYGGIGQDHGAAGTIFVREIITGLKLNTTIVDNNKRVTDAKTKIMHEQQVSYTIRLLRLVKSARLEIASVNMAKMKIDILQMNGDNSGSLYVRNNQTLSLSASKAVSSGPFIFPWALIVKKGGTLNLAPKLLITRTQSTPSLYLAGRLIGGQEISIGQNAIVVVANTGVIGSTSALPGKFLFRSLQVSSGGKLTFESDVSTKTPVEIQSLSLDIAYGGIMEGSYLLIKTPVLKVAFNGTIRTNGLGYPAGQGPGRGSGTSGGSYGGCGGSTVSNQCKLYGSLYRATEFGSGGAGSSSIKSNAGHGGGIIQIDVDNLINEGLISSNGADGYSSLGGGSGGTVNITVAELITGRGVIDASGGSSQGRGAGGGGRVSLLITGQYKYSGQLFSKGGISSSLIGSPGTVYIEENRPGLRSKRLVIDNRGDGRSMKVDAYLNETNVESYSFKELSIYGNVVLHFEKDATLYKLISDEKSKLHVKDNVVLVIEPDSKSLEPDCSIHVDRDGEIRVPDIVSFRGASNIFAGTLTGVLEMIIGVNRKTQFSSSARTARFVDGKYTYITDRGSYQFSALKIKRLAKLSFENTRLKRVPMTVGSLELNHGAVLQGSWMDIRATTILVNSGAKIDLAGQGHVSESGPGSGKTINSIGIGAGHGGNGGLVTGKYGHWYGVTKMPNMTGSGGGNGASGVGGFGGGYLHLKVVLTLRVDGEIRTDGNDCTGANCGGGSGGSIVIFADDITGNGFITSEGGKAKGKGGGGSGGRIAVYTEKTISFEGSFTTIGGTSPSGPLGAAGTVYIQDSNKRIPRKRLFIQNLNIKGNRPTTVLSEPLTTVFYFDEMKMTGSVRFEIFSSLNEHIEINMNKFNADSVGEMAVKRNQTLYAEVFEAKESHLMLTTNVHIEEGANMVVSSNLSVDGATLRVDGKISNVRHMVVESGGRVQFGLTSQTTLMHGDKFVFQSRPGTQQFASITLKSGSDFGAPENLKILVTKLDLKNGVTLRGKYVDIQAQTFLIGRGAVLTTNAAIQDKMKVGVGINSGSGGSGGGHGSAGGDSGGHVTGGQAYGTIYEPNEPGSPGGVGTNPGSEGKGGGVVRITADFLLNDGYITANGGDASSSSGGGSGGSIFLTIKQDFQGTGLISTNGGRGAGSGGCGSGGRVAVHVMTQLQYRGTLQALGAVCSSSEKSGGPGTVFIKEIRYKSTFTQLRIDNRGQGWKHYVTLNETTQSYTFNEIYIYNNASLRMLESDNDLSFDVRKVYGDKSGLLHVRKNQKAYLEVLHTQNSVTKTPINLKVESGGELVMAAKSYIVGTGSISLEVNGTLTQVQDLYVTQNKLVILHKGARTSKQNEPMGTFSFSNVKIYSGSSFIMRDEPPMKLVVGFLNIKYGASFSAHYLNIKSGKIDIETGSLLSCAGDNAARKAVPSSEISKLPQGEGGSHASSGGKGIRNVGGSYHGSIFKPTDPGRRGGDGGNSVKGGSGGGYIKIEVGNELINDGTVTVAGERAKPSTGAGGGSGGSIFITTEIFSGKFYKKKNKF